MPVRIPLNPPLKPRNGQTVKAIGIARISGGPNQTEKSNEDQEALYRTWLKDRCEAPFDLSVIAGIGSGERLDREELDQARTAIQSGDYDLVIAEDLGRIMRRVQALYFCEVAEDAGVRVIAINDSVDTAVDGWKLSAFFASMRHELYNADTAKRIRRTQRNRFSSGGMIKIPLFCYVKPPECKSDADLTKDPQLEPIVLGIFDRLEAGWSFARIADWLNQEEIPLGAGCRRTSWNGPLVRRIVFNPILKGVRVWNAMRSVRVNATGRRKQIPAPPDERLERSLPHLAFIEADRYDQLIDKLREQGKRYSVPLRRGDDPRKGRPKKRTRWPGQHAYCQLCGCLYVYGGHGKTAHLMCSGAREYNCWNGVTFDAGLAAQRISSVVFDLVSGLPEFEPALLQSLQEEASHLEESRNHRFQQVAQKLEAAHRDQQRLVEAVKKSGGLDALITALQEVEGQRRSLEFEMRQLKERQPAPIALPGIDQIRREVRQAFDGLLLESPEYGDCMREIIDKIVVFPVQLCDGASNPVLRARFTVDFTSHLPTAYHLPSLQRQLRQEITVDLFDMPQRAACREQVISLRSQELTEREVAEQLGLTQTAVQRAAALDRLMQTKGITDPYLPLTAPPVGNRRYRRHHHLRYQEQASKADSSD